jgi:hypothetical protein
MEKLFLLEAPAGGGTKIVLNKQSDLILHEAEIIKPSGIEEGDIIGLPEHFEKVEGEIKQEVANRVAGDEALQADLETAIDALEAADAAEAAERAASDKVHDAAIKAEEAARIEGDNTLTTNLNAEVARATAKDAEHDAAIAAESEARTAADAAHDVEIAAIKETEATNVATLQGNIDSEQARAEAAEKVNADAIAKEVSDRISAVSTEEAARIAGDAALQASLDAMDAAYKSADAGLQSAIDSAQAEINGILSGSTLDANSFAEIVTLINSVDTENDTAFASYVLSNDAALAQEVADRIAGDDKLTGDLAAEVVRATAAEAANAAAIAKEEADRVAADAALQASLDAEISGRTAADVAFQASLDAEIANRVAGDDTLTTNLNAEVARAEAAEQVNAQAIADEVVARTTKDAEQDAALTTEVDRAKAAEKVNADAIAAEEARAIAAEGVLDTAIKEESARISGDTAIQAELSEAVAELEGVNKAQDEKAAKFEAETNAAIAAEEARAIAAEGVLDTAIKAEEARAKSKDAEHDAAIAAEEARAIAAEGVLDAAIAAETARAKDAEKAMSEAISKEESERIAAITTQKERIDIILSGSSVDLDQFSEVVKFVEDIDMNNDASLISAIDEVRKEHKSDMDAEVSNREKADAEIIAAVGYNDRGAASNSHFEGYLDASAEFGQATEQLAMLNDVIAELNVEIASLKSQKAEAEAAGNTDLVNKLTADIAVTVATKADQEAEKKDLESSGALSFEAFMPINEVNFEAWKKDVEATELEGVRTELFDSIKKEADSSVGRDSEIIAAVGYNDRGAASNSHFEGYLNASGEFGQATKDLAMLNDIIAELNVEIASLEAQKAEAEAAGNTDLVNSLTEMIAANETAKAEQEAEKKGLESSGVLEFEAFMPVNEVNFEAWKKDTKDAETSENFAKLNKGLEDEIARATAAEGELTVKVADIIENTDVSKIDSFVEVINEFNKVSEANFDSIYAKKVGITFNGVSEVMLANLVKPESMMLYINGLMVENGVDYTEIVEGGMVAGATLLGDALDLAVAGAKLASYGVHGSFSSVEFNGIDYAALINAKQAELVELEAQKAEATDKHYQSKSEFESLIAKLKSEIEAANAAGDADYAAKAEAELANVEAARDEELSAFNELVNSINSQIQSLNAEIAKLHAEAAEA